MLDIDLPKMFSVFCCLNAAFQFPVSLAFVLLRLVIRLMVVVRIGAVCSRFKDGSGTAKLE